MFKKGQKQADLRGRSLYLAGGVVTRAHFLKRGATKRSKRWAFLFSREFSARREKNSKVKLSALHGAFKSLSSRVTNS